MEKLITLGTLVILAGVAILVFGIMGSALQTEPGEAGKSEVRAGGVILIGPVPIVFGSDKTMVFVSIAAAILFLIAYYVWRTR